MLATLAVNLSIMLILYALLLLICWAYDTVGDRVEAEGSHRAESGFPVPPRPRGSPVRPAASSRPQVWYLRPPPSRLWWPPRHLTARSDPVRPGRELP
jgi:hypothetical protein